MPYSARHFLSLRGSPRLQPSMHLKMRVVTTSWRLWKLSSIACWVLLATQAFAGTALAQPTQPTLAPVVNEGAPNAIPGQYIVVFKRGTSRHAVLAAQEKVEELGGTIMYKYTSALIGFGAKLPEGALQALRGIPGVDYIEADQKISGDTVQPPNPPTEPPTGLDRTSERLLQLDKRYTYSETGTGVHVYVIDSGIRSTHSEFGGRASWAFDAIGGNVDCHGHGTNVAGIIGGATYGIAKGATLHAVRVLDCSMNGWVMGGIAGIDWVTANAIHPAVANLSFYVGSGGAVSLDNAVANSIASGVTYTVSGGENAGVDACTQSPARVPTAITVGAIDPTNDKRAWFSNFGPCLDLFAPGVDIKSGGIASDTATSIMSGMSQAAPHVAGVAARWLQNHPFDSPADVWAAIHNADNVSTTTGWPGIGDPGVGSPNELLHFGSLNDGFNDGDPHLTTVDGIHYDFQSAGEFVTLRDGNGLEIQTRQTPVSTAPPVANPHTGLAVCVSVNTAIAARVGAHRISYMPNISGVVDPSGLQLRVDGSLTTLPQEGLNLGPEGRIQRSSSGSGIEVDFPDGTVLTAIPNWWASQSLWYLNVSVFHTRASEGTMGAIVPQSWLPALPDGSSMGPMPADLQQRYVDLYQKFVDAWRVDDKTTLFDYALGASAAAFADRTWPPEKPPCVTPQSKPAEPLDLDTARNLCDAIEDKSRYANCVFDVMVTGEPGFAKIYAVSDRIAIASTRTTVDDDKDPSQAGDAVAFIATVAPLATNGRGVPVGTVQFTLDDTETGNALGLDAKGQAVWKTSRLQAGKHRVAARYIPAERSVYLPSTSLDEPHAVRDEAAQ